MFPQFMIRSKSFLFAILSLLGWSATAQTLTITNGVQTYSTLNNTTVTMAGRCELRVTDGTSPLTGCVINLNSADVWLFLTGIKPSVVAASYLSQVRVSGAVAVADSNVRVVQYAQGTAVIPQPSTFKPLQVFSGQNFQGVSSNLALYTYYTGTGLGALNHAIRSFKLKRGYMATFAQNVNGTGLSKVYIAQDGDLEVSLLPSSLDNSFSFVYVLPWRWVTKKGIAGNIENGLNVSWKYNWNLDQNSTRDLEYVPIRQQRWWPDLNQNWQTRGANTVLGYNEPDNTAQANLAVGDAIWSWPDLLATGLRVGSPAVTDGGRSGWLYPFMQQADAAGLRVDFVAVHYYWCYNPADPNGAATQMYNFLKATYDQVKRPIWVTEWNNGADWTGCGDPTFAQQQAAVAKMIDMLESTPFVERYAIYNWVEDVRRVQWDDGSLTDAGVTYRDKVSALSYRQELPDTGSRSLSQFHFDGDTLDSSGFGNNGLQTGQPGFVAGQAGQAIDLDGTNSYAQLPPNVANSADFTFAAWVNWDGGASWQRIFDFGDDTTHYLFLTPGSGAGTLRFAIRNGGSEQVLETAALPVGQWRHVAVTLNGNTGRLYTNGVLAASGSITIDPSSFGPAFNYLGKSTFVADPLFNGRLDEVLIADYALSDSQIAALLTNQPPQFTSAVLTKSLANKSQPYSDTLAGDATDPDAGDALTFSKASGPAWLTVAANGSLGGTPGLTDGGTNSFIVRVTDSAGASAFATLNIFVNNQASLVARYEFEGNTLSSVGNTHGALTGPASYVAGHLGQAIDLDGTTNYITLPAGVANSDDITVAMWVNWDGGAAWQRIFDFGNGTAQNMFLTPKAGDGAQGLRFVIKDGTEQAVETTVLPVGVWRHVAVTLSGNIGRIYVNGVQVAASGAMTFNPSGFNPVTNYIGKSMYPDPLFNGRIDGFHIYNYALSAAQIAGLYTGAPPAFTSDPFTRPSATPGRLYTSTIAGSATDPNGGTLTYNKVSGPAWLQVASNGALSGTPGAANVGLNSFTVRVNDPVPISDEATLNILVTPGSDALGLFAFEGNTANSVGINHGTASGSPLYVAGVNGQAISLNGSSQFVTLPAGMVNVNDITIATRVYWNGGAQWQRIFDFGNNTTNYLFLTPRSGGNTLRFTISTNSYLLEQRVETATQLTSNQWVHLAVTLQGDTGKLYVDGVLAASNTITLNPSTFNPVTNYIGKSVYPDPLFNGLIDDFQIYNRALSAFEIANLANPAIDSDGDGLSDTTETDLDSDGDGIPNYLDLDSDNDGVPDMLETYADTDTDGIPNILDTDSDNDGLPDGWEFAHGLNMTNAADALDDLDGDGQSNLAEYVAGTSPNDLNDYFSQSVEPGPLFSVTLSGRAGRTYTLLRSSLPTAPIGSWVEVMSLGPLAEDQPVTLTDPAPPAEAAFYRAAVAWP